ncbi:helix-turn-helix transcriptional regulator [Daejeonella sp. JGW-45]|uniref:helix-turn-helix domain-containing protein n=1 Tax=Daejeonella sp. JGW-45 TaxID=3034148 RepID=UPI0023EA8228|nr:helix-turn-helix transcriptional regulator [Daejeonella sp. JGW-45]
MENEIPVYDISSVSEFRKDRIQVSRFSPYFEAHNHLRHAHRHNFYHVLLFTQGRGTHSIDFETFAIRPYQIYFMAPGQVHSWDLDGFVDGYIINFSAEVFQSFLLKPDFIDSFRFFRGNVSDSVIDIPISLQSKIESFFEDMLLESACDDHFGLTMVKVLAINVFVLVARLFPSLPKDDTSSYNYTLLKNFQKLISINYRTLKFPKEYAELLYITPNHLNALCNDLLGLSAGEVIRNRIFLEARRLLINPDLSVSEIAHLLNFTDNSYFTKAFKKHVGQTPEEFKKAYKP